jgi:hypothetical protein
MPPDALSPPSPTNANCQGRRDFQGVDGGLDNARICCECHQKIPVYDDVLLEIGSRPAANKDRENSMESRPQ